MTRIGLLDYTVQPPAVFINQTVSLELVITNPLSGSPVVFAGGSPQNADQLKIGFATEGENALVKDLDFTAEVTAQPQLPDPPSDEAVPFIVVRVGTNFLVKPQGTSSSASSTLLPGQSLKVTFDNVPIDAEDGSGHIDVTQLIGPSATPAGTLEIEKKPIEPSIVAWFDNPLIAGGATGTLRWTAVGGTRLDIQGFPYGPGTKTFNLDGTPPVSGSTTASILDSASSQTYTLNVIKPGSGTVASAQRTLQFHVPFISLFAPMEAVPPLLRADRPVDFRYATAFTAAASLITPIQSRPLPSPINGTVTVQPGEDAFRIGGKTTNIPGTVNYTLEARGYLNPASQTVPIRLAPIEVLSFKFQDEQDGVLSRARATIVPETWPGMEIETRGSDLLVLTVWGPGGQKAQRYLGSGDTIHPQIQYCESKLVDGDAVEVSWVTANLTKLAIRPGGIDIPVEEIARGSRPIDLGGADRVVLTGTAANGETVDSILIIHRAAASVVPCSESST